MLDERILIPFVSLIEGDPTRLTILADWGFEGERCIVKRGLTREEVKIELLKSLLKSEGTE